MGWRDNNEAETYSLSEYGFVVRMLGRSPGWSRRRHRSWRRNGRRWRRQHGKPLGNHGYPEQYAGSQYPDARGYFTEPQRDQSDSRRNDNYTWNYNSHTGHDSTRYRRNAEFADDGAGDDSDIA